MPKSPDWKKIKAEYIQGGTSYRKLSVKYGVSFSTLRQIAARENWTDLKDKTRAKIDIKLSESVAKNQGERFDRLITVTDKLLNRIEESINNREICVDAQSIKQITGALKDIKDISGLKCELERQEQMARISKLQKEAKDEEASKDIKIVIGHELDEYSK